MKLTQKRLKFLLRYDPISGVFIWNVWRGGTARKGSVAGTLHVHGYIHIWVDGKTYKAHRLAWLYMKGCFPKSDIEHKDLNKSNNAWFNLRLGDDSKNQANTRFRGGASGFKGVTLRKNKKTFRARITCQNRRIHLGDFSTATDAHVAYAIAAQRLFGEFARVQ